MIDILLFSSRGHCRQQQDAISVDAEVIQADEHLSQRRVDAHELLLGLADGVAASRAAAHASKREMFGERAGEARDAAPGYAALFDSRGEVAGVLFAVLAGTLEDSDV